MNIKIKKLNKNATMPTRKSKEAAGYDLCGCNVYPITIDPHTTIEIGSGLAIEIPNKYFGAIFARSGISINRGLRPANCVGVIDSDYRGDIIVALHNDTDNVVTIEPKERIAQLVIMPYENIEFEEVDELSDTERGDSGRGSTGTK